MGEHINLLLLIGTAVFIGLSGGKIFQKLKIPQVVGYIIIGVLLGDSVLGLLRHDLIEILTPLNSFALGLIGFMIGGELKSEIFKKYGITFIIILLFEGIITFFLVSTAITFFTGKLYLGILFGALASATAPAATVDVLWEYKSKGILTTTILAIVALDDGLALILYGFANAFAKTLITGQDFAFTTGFLFPLLEIGYALGLGFGVGYLLYQIILKIHDREQMLVLSIGSILVTTGLATVFDLDLILANMAMGVILANTSTRISGLIFGIVKSFTPPIYVLFFVLVGARLQVGLIPQMGMIGLIYLLARIIGKLSGSYLGASVAKTEAVVKKYLGLTLFSQAGVAIGLAIAIFQSFSKLGPAGQEAGMLIINIIAATTFFVQIIGPPCVKFGIGRAGEIGKDITEEDILTSYKVDQVMETKIDLVNAHDKLSEVINLVKRSTHIYLPVIDREKKFLGVISFQNIKDAMFETELGELVLAGEVATYNITTSHKAEQLKSAMDKFMYVNLNFLPVVESPESSKFVGILHKRTVARMLKNEMLGKLIETKNEPAPEKGFSVSKLIDIKNIKMELESEKKNEVIEELAELMAEANNISSYQNILSMFLERESQTTTGIGDGIAIPHIRTDKVLDAHIVIGKSTQGINFKSVDNKPVHLIFMVAIPSNYPESPLKIMSALSKLLRNQKLKESMINAKTSKNIIELLSEWEKVQ